MLTRALDYLLMQGSFDPEKLTSVQRRRQSAVVWSLHLAALVFAGCILLLERLS